ncbi:DUF721 domain-containing protein [Candidatus Omnitrophota bacterium]
MKKRTGPTEDIKDILSKLVKKIEKQGPGKKEKISQAWKKAAGEKATFHSRPVNLARKILTVEVDSSTWLYSLSLKKRSILKGMKKDLEQYKIEDIRFRMGDIT